jgi:hypothetical protein
MKWFLGFQFAQIQGEKKKEGVRITRLVYLVPFNSQKIVKKKKSKKLYENCILFIARFGLKNLPFSDHHFSNIKKNSLKIY